MKKIILCFIIVFLTSCNEIEGLTLEHEERSLLENFYLDFTIACNKMNWDVYYIHKKNVYFSKEKIRCYYNNNFISDLEQIKRISLNVNND